MKKRVMNVVAPVLVALISVLTFLMVNTEDVHAATRSSVQASAYTQIEQGNSLFVKTQGVTTQQVHAAKEEVSNLPSQLLDRLQKDGVVIRFDDPEMKILAGNSIGYWQPGTKVTTKNGDHVDMSIVETTIDVDASELMNPEGKRTVLHEIGHQLDCGSWQHQGIESYFNATAEGEAFYAKYKDLIGSYDSYAAVSVETSQEFFAEAFGICEENKTWAAENCPDLYDWFQGIINQYIYG